MANVGFVFSGPVSVSVSVADAVEAFRSLGTLASGVDVAGCEPEALRLLTAGVRDGQRALDLLLIRVGVAAEQQDAEGKGRGAQGTLLGDGSKVRGCTARQEADRARAAAEMSKVRAAVEQGRIGAAQIDAISRAAKDLSAEERQKLNTNALIGAAENLAADVFARRVREEAERIRGDHGLADTKARQARASWKHWMDNQTGMGKIAAEFDPERYEAIVNAVEAQVTRLANKGGVAKNSNLVADAAFQLLTSQTQHGQGLPHINVVVDLDTMQHGPNDGSLRETAAGHPLPPQSISRLACDAILQRVVFDKNRIPVDVGRKHRTATDAQWQALRAVYRACAWQGCQRSLSWCQAHHIHEWEHSGPTDLCNLIPLCHHHHHAVHEGGWKVKLHDDRRLDIYDPDRILWATARPDRIGRQNKRTLSGDCGGRGPSSETAQPGGP